MHRITLLNQAVLYATYEVFFFFPAFPEPNSENHLIVLGFIAVFSQVNTFPQFTGTQQPSAAYYCQTDTLHHVCAYSRTT